MKTKYWVVLFGALLAVCVGMSFWLLGPGEPSRQAEIWSDGKLLCTLDLLVAQTMTVDSQYGTNEVTVKDGAIAVTDADCPDGYCIARGFCNGGAQIVCLPHRLVIRFLGTQQIDGVVG